MARARRNAPKVVTVVRRRRATRRARALNQPRRIVGRPLMQGAMAAPRKAFGNTALNLRRAFDATHPGHFPLPRAVGPYTVVRTTAALETTANFMYFGTFSDLAAPGGGVGALEHPTWTNVCGLFGVNPGASVSAPNNAGKFIVPNAFESATMTPAAITVQVMCPTALQAATGTIYMGRSSAQYDLSGSTRTWDALGSEFVSYMSPRVLTAGKLALRGVKCSSYPLDMSDLADFRRSENQVGGAFTWDGAQRLGPGGFAPIVIYNLNGATLSLLVTIEWRVRFDPGEAAAGSHQHHPCVTDKIWEAATQASVGLGHGVEDIVEGVAQEGVAAARGLAGEMFGA